jgi:cation:H+ antiporter
MQDWPLWGVVLVFLGAAGAILLSGVRLAHVADALADRTGMGEVVAGALFVGASTSLPGAITSVSTALQGHESLAIGNSLGGLTAQTAFIAIADLFYRRANLEHAAASVTGLAQAVLLIALLSMPLIAATEPDLTIGNIHPVSIVIVLTYIFGLRLLTKIKAEPMWRAVQTDETREEQSEVKEGGPSERSLWISFLMLAGATAVGGYLIGEASIALVAATGLGESAFGTVFTAVANSLPELVTAIAAVRIGAVSLAVGDIIGGNAFEVLFLCLADAVTEKSIYAAFQPNDMTTALIAILMTGVLLLGMLRREREGVGGIGFESAIVLALYAGSVVLVFV